MSETTRSDSPGRRIADDECKRHEKELEEVVKDLDDIQENVAKNSGRFAAMLWFMGILGAALTIGVTIMISLLMNIQSSLNINNIAMAEDRKDIKAIREIEIPQIKKEIADISERHKWEDQNKSKQ